MTFLALLVLLALILGASPTMILIILWIVVYFFVAIFLQEVLHDWWKK